MVPVLEEYDEIRGSEGISLKLKLVTVCEDGWEQFPYSTLPQGLPKPHFPPTFFLS
jgi:hypothetical protein